MSDPATFEVTGHYVLPERGAFLIGHIRSGIFRTGMRVGNTGTSEQFTIAGIEFLDNTAAHKHWNALVFRERPTLATVERAFPVGSLVLATVALS